MRAYLLFLVSLLFPLTLFAESGTNDTVSVLGQSNHYAFEITTPKAALTGIMIVKESDGVILGSMVNEFGVSAIDFSYDRSRDKLKLLNVVGFLDKWYIKMTMKKDLRLCLHVLFAIPYKSEKNYEISFSSDSYQVVNKKRKITYTFTRMSLPEDDTERQSI